MIFSSIYLPFVEVTKQGLVPKEIAPIWTVDEVQEFSQPKLIVASDLQEMEL